MPASLRKIPISGLSCAVKLWENTFKVSRARSHFLHTRKNTPYMAWHSEYSVQPFDPPASRTRVGEPDYGTYHMRAEFIRAPLTLCFIECMGYRRRWKSPRTS